MRQLLGAGIAHVPADIQKVFAEPEHCGGLADEMPLAREGQAGDD
jgi:hypothetical protein